MAGTAPMTEAQDVPTTAGMFEAVRQAAAAAVVENDPVETLRAQVTERLGDGGRFSLHLDATSVGIYWRRSYDGILSDERSWYAQSVASALTAVIAYEDYADRLDAHQAATGQ